MELFIPELELCLNLSLVLKRSNTEKDFKKITFGDKSFFENGFFFRLLRFLFINKCIYLTLNDKVEKSLQLPLMCLRECLFNSLNIYAMLRN